MGRLKGYVLSASTLACALGIGYVMQYGFGAPSPSRSAQAPMEVTEVVMTSSAVTAPRLVPDRNSSVMQPERDVQRAAAEPLILETNLPPDWRSRGTDARRDSVAPGFACAIDMQAEAAAAAMVLVSLSAPCHADERVTIHHQGMMFTEVMDGAGRLNLTVPALTENASIVAAFPNGEGAAATADVTSLSFYDRVVVQWKGDAGLQLHAREFTDAYFSEGHVWTGAAGDIAATVQGRGGFLTRLGRDDAPDGLLAEVYTFPTGTAKTEGDVLLSVEAEITGANCDTAVAAQTLELRGGDALRTQDLALEMPGCDAAGDFLVLKNLVDDLTIASR